MIKLFNDVGLWQNNFSIIAKPMFFVYISVKKNEILILIPVHVDIHYGGPITDMWSIQWPPH